MIHVPILRAGRTYRSVDRAPLAHVVTGEPLAEMSLANRGLISRDLQGAARLRAALAEVPTPDLLSLCRVAAGHFAESDLEMDGAEQSPEEFVVLQSQTTGLPRSLCRANMEKVRFVLDEMERVLAGWTRGLDLNVLDAGWGRLGERIVSYRPQADTLGAVLPSNSPGVHSLWIPAIAMKVPVVLRPGSREPWTPLRVARALQAAGCPPEAVSFYPSDHGGGTEILLRCQRSMLFGDQGTLRAWADDPRVQLHGPGWSKVILDQDQAERFPESLDLMVASVAENAGRSCINASGIWTTARGREIAQALAERLAAVPALPLEDPAAQLAAFPDPQVAHRISAHIDRLLSQGGAEDVTAGLRSGGRLAEAGGCTFLLPTVIHCETPDHPLARTELLFPFVAVVEVPRERLLSAIGPTLVATGLTRDLAFERALLHCRDIERLNLGPIPTSRISWDQPHEGNLFEHLYRQRAVQTAAPPFLSPAGSPATHPQPAGPG